MNTSLATESPATDAATQDELPLEINDFLHQCIGKCKSKAEVFRFLVRYVGQKLNGPYASLLVNTRSGTITDRYQPARPQSSWKELCHAMLLKSQCNQLALARTIRNTTTASRFAVMSVPISLPGEGVVGAIALIVPFIDSKLLNAQLSELNLIATSVGLFLGQGSEQSRPREENNETASAMAKAGQHQSLHEFAFAIVNGLKGKLGCEQVCLGLVKRHRVKMLSMSGFDNLFPRNPGARQVEHAMEECLDAEETLCFQQDDDRGSPASTGHQLHRIWHNNTGRSSVASVPLLHGDQCVAILSLRNGGNRKFKPEQLQKIQEMVSPMASGILLLQKAGRSWFQHSLDSMGDSSKSWMGRRAWARQIAILMVAATIGLFAFGKCDYQISVPCEILPAETRQIAAPFEGTIESILVQPGDRVERGDLLARIQTDELELELQRLLSEKKVAALEIAEANAEKNLAAAAQANARLGIIQGQIKLIEYKIAKSEIRAPESGTIMQGDLQSRVGSVVSLGEPLFQFSQTDRWTAKLQVPENIAIHFKKGLPGQLTTNARPDEPTPIEVHRVHQHSMVVDGKNTYTVEAEVVGEPPEWMLGGMKGVSRVNTGQRPIWWVWFNRPVDSVRLFLWRMSP